MHTEVDVRFGRTLSIDGRENQYLSKKFTRDQQQSTRETILQPIEILGACER